MGKFIRRVVTAIFTILILPFFVANLQRFLREKHWDEFLLTWWPAMPNLDYLIKSSWFLYLLFFLGVATTALWIIKLLEPKFEIIKAEYWSPSVRFDVTEELRKDIVDNKLTTIASNAIKGDPEKGAIKILSIEYKFKGKKIKKDFREKDLVVIP